MVDIHKPGEYPVILGDSLKDEAESSSSYLGIRYNWTPKNSFSESSGRLRQSSSKYSLSYEHENSSHEYIGWLADEVDQTSQLALFYNDDKSAFVLEKVSASFNFNVKSSSELSSDQIKRHPQLEKPKDSPEANLHDHNEDNLFDDAEDESPDPSNPFDYRNFLTEAKENVDKASQQTVGGRTPIPGARTPLNGISSPLPGATGRFISTTPQFAPTEIRSTKRKPDEEPQSRRKAAATAKGKSTKKPTTTTSRPRASSGAKQNKPLSSEIVIDSSDEDSDVAIPSPPPRSEPSKSNSKPKPKPIKNQNRTMSPLKVTEDEEEEEEGGLEIVDDSPPPSSKRKPQKINPDSFRRGPSGTTKPIFSHSRDRQRIMHDVSDADTDADEEVDIDVEGLLPASDDDMSQNGDIPDLILEESEPESEPEPLPAPRPKRRQSSIIVNKRPRDPPMLPQPVNTRHDHDSEDDEDGDGALAAALEEALEKEEQRQAAGGLMDDDHDGFGNIGNGGGSGGGDEESEISEED